jgi:hypothetical protein
MSDGAASLLTTNDQAQLNKARPKREWWQWPCVAQESYCLFYRTDTFVGAHPNAARHQANATGIVLAGLFEESRVKALGFVGLYLFHEWSRCR